MIAEITLRQVSPEKIAEFKEDCLIQAGDMKREQEKLAGSFAANKGLLEKVTKVILKFSGGGTDTVETIKTQLDLFRQTEMTKYDFKEEGPNSIMAILTINDMYLEMLKISPLAARMFGYNKNKLKRQIEEAVGYYTDDYTILWKEGKG